MENIIRVHSVVPLVNIGDTDFNYSQITENLKEIKKDTTTNVVLFPELCFTGATCEDLFLQTALIEDAKYNLLHFIYHGERSSGVKIFGLPLMIDGQLYNCAVVLNDNNQICGIVPKTYLTNEEKRWFSSANDLKKDSISSSAFGITNTSSYSIPVGNNIVFKTKEFTFGVEIGEDIYSPYAPNTKLALSGAEVIFNISASTEIIGRRKFREDTVKMTSAKNICSYILVSAGATESTTHAVYSGHTIVANNGKIIAENEDYIDVNYVIKKDIDLSFVRAERIKNEIFKETAKFVDTTDIKRTFIQSEVLINPVVNKFGKDLNIKKLPFVPDTMEERTKRCNEVFELQVEGLKKRIFTTGSKLVLGVSGGLDSTLALLVAVETMKRLGRPSKNVIGITMPGFGTSGKTYQNSLKLMELLDITSVEIPIKDACIQHFKDIDHDINDKSVTYENAQARERTQILMDYANKVKGLVVGTGDLSELALGWCTYNGDHMSMYGVNGGIPKTLIRWMIETLKETDNFEVCKDILTDILDTPISPELLPPDANGKIAQKTEDAVGPYALHDFFLYYLVRYNFTPTQIFEYAKQVFVRDFTREEILKWLETFYRRFFAQQFKRNCQPDGVRIGTVSLAPNDWRMPSDACANLWLTEIEKLKKH